MLSNNDNSNGNVITGELDGCNAKNIQRIKGKKDNDLLFRQQSVLMFVWQSYMAQISA